MSQFYMFKGRSRAEFEYTSSRCNPIKRWNDILCKKAKLEEIFWKVEREYGPDEEDRETSWSRRHVRGYMKFKKTANVKDLMNMGQDDFTYIACSEGYNVDGHCCMFSNT
jgi:hypothetical protein